VIEFNARFGDPEAEVTLPLLQTDLVEIATRVDQRTLSSLQLDWKDEWALCVVMTAAGYPGETRTGDVISGLDRTTPGTIVFHAGTALRDNELTTRAGRVVIPTGTGATFAEARERAYAAAAQITFDGEHHRSDIGWRAEAYLKKVAADGTTA
jgi:phosphoribosylamine---glycine ligase